MDIRQLRYFIAIAEERQITAAANRLHIAQPPLSQQLKQMETELGVTLVLRNGRALELTEAGRSLYRHALHITKRMDESAAEVKEIGNGLRGQLTIGVNTLSNVRLPALLRSFRTTYPNITYSIRQNESAQLCSMVKERTLELAIVWLPLELSDFTVLHLPAEPFYYITSDPPASNSASVTFEDIAHRPLILPSTQGLGVYYTIMEQFARRQLTPDIVCECSDIAMLMTLVSSGFGAAVVPASVLRLQPFSGIHSLEIEGSQPASSALIWLKDHYVSKSARSFIELLKNTQE
ncbi:LysR family transcriptional regulator [Paenibacillus sp. MER TA 81-3]|uniref:LysR family transcriptional regulator n=1 Tax=Paenibacillus sp. MER TA 81-3 TaxID=2939573 RepID=UPI002041F31D|nr:LysR family transcriptional regulator [Paenibacillus sp. MER TA 81-3]MCM3339571.1 LysR family transcriptional regulator [Paenibacillus sp. MER TA 81-3]